MRSVQICLFHNTCHASRVQFAICKWQIMTKIRREKDAIRELDSRNCLLQNNQWSLRLFSVGCFERCFPIKSFVALFRGGWTLPTLFSKVCVGRRSSFKISPAIRKNKLSIAIGFFVKTSFLFSFVGNEENFKLKITEFCKLHLVNYFFFRLSWW